jgi:hypothetical protein
MPTVGTSLAATSVTAFLRLAAAGQTSPESEKYDFSSVATPPASGLGGGPWLRYRLIRNCFPNRGDALFEPENGMRIAPYQVLPAESPRAASAKPEFQVVVGFSQVDIEIDPLFLRRHFEFPVSPDVLDRFRAAIWRNSGVAASFRLIVDWNSGHPFDAFLIESSELTPSMCESSVLLPLIGW